MRKRDGWRYRPARRARDEVDHARYKMAATGRNAGTTYYLNEPSSGAMEERSIVGGVTTWRDDILANGKRPIPTL